MCPPQRTAIYTFIVAYLLLARTRLARTPIARTHVETLFISGDAISRLAGPVLRIYLSTCLPNLTAHLTKQHHPFPASALVTIPNSHTHTPFFLLIRYVNSLASSVFSLPSPLVCRSLTSLQVPSFHSVVGVISSGSALFSCFVSFRFVSFAFIPFRSISTHNLHALSSTSL